MGNINKDVIRVIESYIEEKIGDALGDFIVISDSEPSSASKVGQLFLRTGSNNPGLYISTGTTTPGWKAVSHAS